MIEINKKKVGKVALIASLLLMAGLYRGAGFVLERIGDLPVRTMSDAVAGSTGGSTGGARRPTSVAKDSEPAKVLYPVLVTAPETEVPPASDNTALDGVFVVAGKGEPKDAGRSVLREVAAPSSGLVGCDLDGVSGAGAFLSGRFYGVGEPIDGCSLDGLPVILESVSGRSVGLSAGRGKVQLSLGG